MSGWTRKRVSSLENFQKFIALAHKEARLSQVHAFLRWFFSPMLSPQPNIGIFWDAGFLFRNEALHFRPTCSPAVKAMMAYWGSAPDALPPLATIQNDAEYGIILEQWVKHQLMAAPPQLRAFKLSSPSSETVISLAPIFTVRYFTEVSAERNQSGRQCLYIPEDEAFHAWDFILHLPQTQPSTLLFLQVSKSSLRQHDYKSPGQFIFKKSLTGAPSLVSKIITGITGITCSTSVPDNGELTVTPTSPLSVLFLFVTSTPKKTIQAGEKSRGEATPRYPNLLVMAKEECKKCLNIAFD